MSDSFCLEAFDRLWVCVGVCVCFGRIASVALFPRVLRLWITAPCRSVVKHRMCV